MSVKPPESLHGEELHYGAVASIDIGHTGKGLTDSLSDPPGTGEAGRLVRCYLKAMPTLLLIPQETIRRYHLLGSDEE